MALLHLPALGRYQVSRGILLLCCAIGLATAGCRADAVGRTAATELSPPPMEAGATGLASFYARSLHGRRTASGIPFDANALVAAHPTYAFGTVLRITNLENGRTVDVEVVDRGPARSARRDGVIVDLSPAAAKTLDFVTDGRTRVRVTPIGQPAQDPP